MLKSISQWAFENDRPLEQVFQMAREHGFEAVEVAIAEDGEITPQTTQEECNVILEKAQKAGVQLSSMASGMGWKYQIISNDEAERRQAIDAIAASLRVTQMLGLDAYLCVPGRVGSEAEGGTPYDAAYDNALAALRELAPVAEETGVTIGVENVWNKFLLSPLEMRDFLDKIGSPRVGCYFDVGNVLIMGYPEQWIRILGKRIAAIHFKDFETEVGTLEGFGDLLAGDVNFKAVIAALRDIGYTGPLTSEFFGCEADLPKISAAMDKISQM